MIKDPYRAHKLSSLFLPGREKIFPGSPGVYPFTTNCSVNQYTPQVTAYVIYKYISKKSPH